jgi:eukaryotic translation initiation factor 2C
MKDVPKSVATSTAATTTPAPAPAPAPAPVPVVSTPVGGSSSSSSSAAAAAAAASVTTGGTQAKSGGKSSGRAAATTSVVVPSAAPTLTALPSIGSSITNVSASMDLSRTGKLPGGSYTTTANQGNAAAVLAVNILDDPTINFAETPAAAAASKNLTDKQANVVLSSPISSKLSQLAEEFPYPLRTGMHQIKNEPVLTNHFQLQIDSRAVFYEYQIMGIPDSETRAGKKRCMRTALESVGFLQANHKSWATDHVKTIISWVNLHQLVPTTKLNHGNPTNGHGAEWRLIDIIDKDVTHHLNFQYVRQVDIQGLQDYCQTSVTNHPLNFDPSPVENALNIVMSKCIQTDNTLHLNGHKFYLRDASFDLKAYHDTIAPLRALRGFTYSVKPAMGNILLNVVPATSAFWRPLLVSEVLQRGLITFNSDENALRGVRVYITYPRGKKSSKEQDSDINEQHSRIKTIRSFGEPCNKQKFSYTGSDKQGNALLPENITVQEYQRKGTCLTPVVFETITIC